MKITKEMITEDNRYLALRDKAATDAAAHRATNARLCQWLGVAAVATWDYGEGGGVQSVYPDLATRAHRETLENALMSKGYAFQAGGWTGHGSAAIFSGDMEDTEVMASTFDQTPQAALFAAAVALMELGDT